MPWTVSDVERHNRGLSDEEKARWVKIANNTLKICLGKGRDRKSCEATAVQVANGVIKRDS